MSSLLGIVIVHFADPAATSRCLESIRRDPSAVDRRVLVVDNSENFPHALLETGEEVLAAGDNPGFGEGANRGLRHLVERASPAWLLVLNHDVELDAGFLDGARRALEIPGVGAAAGPVYSTAREGSTRKAEELWYAGGRIRYLTGTVQQSRSPADARRGREVSFLPGTALALCAAAFEDSGGFDPRFFLYNEDLDLCRRLTARGYKLYFEPAMSCRHRLGTATGSAQASPLYLEHLTAGRFLPFTNPWYRAYLGALHTPYVLLRCAAAALRFGRGAPPRIKALLRGHRRALRSILSG